MSNPPLSTLRVQLAVSAAVSLAALAIGLVALTRGGPRFPSLAPFVKKSQIDLSNAGVNQAANAAVLSALSARGLAPQRVLILRSHVDGAQGVVVVDIRYGLPNGTHSEHRTVTVILHRTAWSAGQITEGAPPGAAN